MGDEPSQLATGIYWDNPQCGLLGVEVGSRGQREWREEMESLQYAALRKCTGLSLGPRGR